MYRILLIIVFTQLFFVGCGNDENKKDDENRVHDQYVIDYLDKVNKIWQNTENAMTALNNAIRSGDTVLMNTVYSDMIGTIKKSLDEAQKVGPLYSDSNLQKELSKLISFYYEIMTGPYIESLNLQKKPDSLFTDKDILRTAQVLDSISRVQKIYLDSFQKQLMKTAKDNRTIIKYKK
jgi:hypothetical protein